MIQERGKKVLTFLTMSNSGDLMVLKLNTCIAASKKVTLSDV